MKGFKLIDRYLLRKFMATFFVAMGLIIVIVIVFDVSERISDFIDKKAPLKLIVFQYYINFIPSFVNDYSPLFTFISVIFFTSKLAGNTEIIAILSSGLSFRRMLLPYFYGALIIASLTFVLGNFVIPHVNIDRFAFEKKYIRRTYYNTFSNIHLQMDKETQVYVQNFYNHEDRGNKFSIEKFGKDEITEKFESESITYDTITKKWTASSYTERTFDKEDETYAKGYKKEIDIDLLPNDFNINNKNVEVMNLPKLSAFIKQEKERGSFMVREYELVYYQRLINPLAVIIMTFIAVSLSFRKVRGGLGLHLALGIGIAFTFIIFMKFSTVFSLNGNLPPLISVLIPLFIFGIAAYWLVLKAPK